MQATNIVASAIAAPMKWIPTNIPIADDDQMDAAVVRPRTLAPLLTMMPAPRNPIPVSRLPMMLAAPTSFEGRACPNHCAPKPAADVSAQRPC